MKISIINSHKIPIFRGNPSSDTSNVVATIINPYYKDVKEQKIEKEPPHIFSLNMLKINEDTVELLPFKECEESIVFHNKKIFINRNAHMKSYGEKPPRLRGKEVVTAGKNNLECKIIAKNNIKIGEKSIISEDLISKKGSITVEEDSYITGDLFADKNIIIKNDSSIQGDLQAKNVYVQDGSSVHCINAETATIHGKCQVTDVDVKKITFLPYDNSIDELEPFSFINDIKTEQKELVLEDINVTGNVFFKDSKEKQQLRIKRGTLISGDIYFENGKGTVILEKGAMLPRYAEIIGGKLLNLNKGLKVYRN